MTRTYTTGTDKARARTAAASTTLFNAGTRVTRGHRHPSAGTFLRNGSHPVLAFDGIALPWGAVAVCPPHTHETDPMP